MESQAPTDFEQWQHTLSTTSTSSSDYQNCLKQLRDYLNHDFEQGVQIEGLIFELTQGTDQVLQKIWQQFELEHKHVALLATGGYGRGELHPASDIDLLILLEKKPTKQISENISQFLTFLWDIGLDVGQSVRTYKECATQAKDDLTIITNLMETRLLCGLEKHKTKLDTLINPKKMWPAKKFFLGKIEEQEQRYHRYGVSAYKLEPNLKESPGGLRDVHMVGWLTTRYFGAERLVEIINESGAFAEELKETATYRNLLWRIRWHLHSMTGRKEDRLLFDHQHELATALGYEEATRNQSIEALMQDYYRAVTQLERLSNMHLQLLKQRIFPVKKEKIVAVNRRFQTNNGYLEANSPKVFEHYPFALLEIFLLLMQNREILGVKADTIRLIRQNLFRIDEEFRASIIARSLFMEMLRQPHGIIHEFRRMNTYGVLGAYWPAFQDVTGRMQFDLFHIYTVDEHIMMVLRNVRRLSVPEHAHTLPECTNLFSELPKTELLYMAALFHDIAKGKEGDHSDVGAVMAREFCLQHNLSEYDTDLVSWLVETHLVMSVTAQRKDIDSPEVIKTFADLVQSPIRLKYLYLLTVCDIRGTDPDLWNSWKASLLSRLYHNTYEWLSSDRERSLDQSEWIQDIKQEALTQLERDSSTTQEITSLWTDFHEEYFERFSPEEINWHSKILNQKEENKTRVYIRPISNRGATEVLICDQVHPRFFSLITRGMEQLQLNILDARIYTTKSGMALDSFQVLESNGSPCVGEHRLEEIRARLESLLDDPEAELSSTTTLPRRLKSFDLPTTIKVIQLEDKPFSQIEISSMDRPGLLADIANTLYQHGARIKMARISTVGEQAQDTIHITSADNNQLSDEQSEQLITALTQAIDLPWQDQRKGFFNNSQG